MRIVMDFASNIQTIKVFLLQYSEGKIKQKSLFTNKNSTHKSAEIERCEEISLQMYPNEWFQSETYATDL